MEDRLGRVEFELRSLDTGPSASKTEDGTARNNIVYYLQVKLVCLIELDKSI